MARSCWIGEAKLTLFDSWGGCEGVARVGEEGSELYVLLSSEQLGLGGGWA